MVAWAAAWAVVAQQKNMFCFASPSSLLKITVTPMFVELLLCSKYFGVRASHTL